MTMTKTRRSGRRVALASLAFGSGALGFAHDASAGTLSDSVNGALNQAGSDLAGLKASAPQAPSAPSPIKALDNFAQQTLGVVPSNLLRTSGANQGDATEFASQETPMQQLDYARHASYEAPQMSQEIARDAVQRISPSLFNEHDGRNDANTIAQAFGAAQAPTSATINQIVDDVNQVTNNVIDGTLVNDVRTAIDNTLNSSAMKEWNAGTDFRNVNHELTGVDRAANGIATTIDSFTRNPAAAVNQALEVAGGPARVALDPVGSVVRVATHIAGPDVMRQLNNDLAQTARDLGRSVLEGSPALLVIPALSTAGALLAAGPAAIIGAGPGALLGAIPGSIAGALIGAPLLGIPGALLGAAAGIIPGALLGALPGAGIGGVLGALAPHNILGGLLTAVPGALLGGAITGGLGFAASLLMTLGNYLMLPLAGAAGASALGLVVLSTLTYGLWGATLIPAFLFNAGLGLVLGTIALAIFAVIAGPGAPVFIGAILSAGFLTFAFVTIIGTGLYALATAWIPTVAYLVLAPLFVGASSLLGAGAGLVAATALAALGIPLITALSALPGALAGGITGYLIGDMASRLLSALAGAAIGGLITSAIGAGLGALTGATIMGLGSSILGAILGGLIGGGVGGLLGAITGAIVSGLIGAGLGAIAGLLAGIPVALGAWALISSLTFGNRMGEFFTDPNRLPSMLRQAADQGWRESSFGRIFGTLGNEFMRNTSTGNALGDLWNRANALFASIAFLDGRRLREMLLRGGLLGALGGTALGVPAGAVPGGILGALLLGPLGLLPGALLGGLVGAPLGAIPGALLGNLIGGPLGAIPAALAGLLNPLNLLNGLMGGIMTAIPGALGGALAGKLLSKALGALTALIVGPLSFLPILAALGTAYAIPALLTSAAALLAALVPPAVIATAAWIIVSLGLSAPLWIPLTIGAVLATFASHIGFGITAWSAIFPPLLPIAAAAGAFATAAGTVAVIFAALNALVLLGSLGLGLVTVLPLTFMLSLPLFIFPALGVPLAWLLGAPALIPVAAGLSMLAGLAAGSLVDNLSSLLTVPLGALLGGALGFPVGAIPATIVSSLVRALTYGVVGDMLGRTIGSILGALAGAGLGALAGSIPGAIIGYLTAAAVGGVNGAITGGIAGGIVGALIGFISGVLLALVTHIRVGAGVDTRDANPTAWFDARIVNKGGFGDSLSFIPGLSGEPRNMVVPKAAAPTMGGAPLSGDRVVNNASALLGV